MGNLKFLNDNPLSKKWKSRYNEQPDEIRKKLDELWEMNIKDYQLKIIKRKRIYPKKGDIFIINPKDDIYFWGIVINNHINNINGEDLLVILIFDEMVNIEEKIDFQINIEKLLIEPSIVGNEYWTQGYFYNVGNIECLNEKIDYGFYSIGKGKYFDEYGIELGKEPQLLGMYGVSTISGVGRKIYQELIIRKIV